MSVELRKFSYELDDYERCVAIQRVVLPAQSHNAVAWQDFEGRLPARAKNMRWVLEIDGEAVGWCQYAQTFETADRHRFYVTGSVLPAWEGRGFGRKMLAHLLEALHTLNATVMQTSAWEDKPRSIHFLRQNGFVETQRAWQNHLDPQAVDLAQWQPALERVQAAGIEIVTLSEVQKRLPDAERQIYELIVSVEADVPNSVETTPIPFDEWHKLYFGDNGLLPEGHFYALADGNLIGHSGLNADSNGTRLHTGLTGVHREWRRRGIALALKLHAIQFAKTYGTNKIQTWNHSKNRGMLAINEALGFVKMPAYIDFELRLGGDDE